MKTHKLTGLLAYLFICILIVPVYAESPLWKVSKGNDFLYIGGTVHVLGKEDFPLPAAFDKAYNNSEQVVFETDMKKLQEPEIQRVMLEKMSYSDGITLDKYLKPETYRDLKAFLKVRNVPVTAIKSFKPGMASTMITMIELQNLGIASEGVDQFYNNKASKDKKTLGKLETVEQQLNILAAMGEGNEDEFIAYTLRDLKQLPKMFKELKAAWRKGDNAKLAELTIDSLKKDFPAIYQSLLVKRNNAWVPQIETMLKTKEVEMVLVGALHLAGEESVLDQLKALGYKIEQLE